MSQGLNIGQMDRKVSIEVFTTTTRASGQKQKTWETYATWWCKLVADNSGEVSANDQRQGSTRYTLRGRYMPSIKHDMRINDNGIYYNIVGVRTAGRNEQTIITAEYIDSDVSNM